MAGAKGCRYKFAAVAVAAACLTWPQGSGARAADDPPPPSSEMGQALAEKLCSGCHVTGANATGVVPAGPPPFAAIANKPGQTGEHIKAVLIQPHVPMPDIHLSRGEMDDILAYLETLRTNSAVPPLVPPAHSQKPKYPEPS